jgi:hypothetical protein
MSSSYLDADFYEFPPRPRDDSPAELIAKNRALAEALLRLAHYCQHLENCAYWEGEAGRPVGSGVRCDCGLRDAVDDAAKAHEGVR